MNEKQARKQAARKSTEEGPQYVVWVFDQGRDVYNREQVRTYRAFLTIEAVYVGGVDIPGWQEVEA